MTETNALKPISNGVPDLTLRDLVVPLFRRKRLLFVVFASVLGLVVLLGFALAPSYSASTEILVSRERLDPLVSTEATTELVTPGAPVTPEEINSEVELLRSRDVLEQVVRENALDRPGGFSFMDLLRPGQTSADRIARAVKTLAKQLDIENIKDSNLIEVTYKSRNPQRSYQVLKSLGSLYVAKHVAVHRAAGSYKFFADETYKYRKELENDEMELRNFAQQHGVAAPNQELTDLSTQVADSVGLLHLAQQSIAADEGRIEDDQQQMGVIPQRSTTVRISAANDKFIDDANAALLAAETKRAQLAMKFAPSYPLVQEADQEITRDEAVVAQAEAKKYVTTTTDRDPTYELLREDLAKSQVDLQAQRASVAATERSIRTIRAQMVNLDQLSLSQEDLEREAKAAETNYLFYLGKREQERTSNALDLTRIANVAVAVPPSIPVLPVYSWPMIVLFGLGSATAAGIGAAYTADYFDPRFQTPAEVIDILGVPVVVAIAKRTS